jgi:hypothetical protein
MNANASHPRFIAKWLIPGRRVATMRVLVCTVIDQSRALQAQKSARDEGVSA